MEKILTFIWKKKIKNEKSLLSVFILGLTQTKVANAINVTFQQIQKYEKELTA